MLDKYITPVIKPLLQPIVSLLDKRQVTADQLTVFGFIIGMLAIPLLALNLWYCALTAIVLNRILDGLDGALARHQNNSTDLKKEKRLVPIILSPAQSVLHIGCCMVPLVGPCLVHLWRCDRCCAWVRVRCGR